MGFQVGFNFQIGGGYCRPMMPMMNSFMMNSCFQMPMMSMLNPFMMNYNMCMPMSPFGNYQHRVLPFDYNMLSNAAWQQVGMNRQYQTPGFCCDYNQIQANAQNWAQNFFTNWTNNQNAQKACSLTTSMHKDVTDTKTQIDSFLNDKETDSEYKEELKAASEKLEAIAQKIKAAESLKQDSTKWLAELEQIGKEYGELKTKISDLIKDMADGKAASPNIEEDEEQPSVTKPRKKLNGKYEVTDAAGKKNEFETLEKANAFIAEEERKAKAAAEDDKKAEKTRLKNKDTQTKSAQDICVKLYKNFKAWGRDDIKKTLKDVNQNNVLEMFEQFNEKYVGKHFASAIYSESKWGGHGGWQHTVGLGLFNSHIALDNLQTIFKHLEDRAKSMLIKDGDNETNVYELLRSQFDVVDVKLTERFNENGTDIADVMKDIADKMNKAEPECHYKSTK
ncbi:MAG: hypothetical protein LBJ74_00240 [Heliobacteriaceae bacterium]|jgi:hypothetical protein|nr:hypothetical protein [Heliobacteriaceae bacterium]